MILVLADGVHASEITQRFDVRRPHQPLLRCLGQKDPKLALDEAAAQANKLLPDRR